VGERWTLLILRDLLLGPRRYSDLSNALKGITSNLLTARLKQLCESGLVEKKTTTGSFPVEAYHLTSLGEEIEPVIMELAQFGNKLPMPDQTELRGDLRWLVLNLKYRYCNTGQPLCLNLNIGDSCFGLTLGESRLLIRDREFNSPVAELTCSHKNMYEWAFGKTHLAKILKQEKIAFNGDQKSLNVLLAAFPEE